MKIENEKYVTIDYVLKNDQGEVLDSSENGDALSYIHGIGALIPGLESALEGQSAGSEINVSVKPEDAYGVHHAELVEEVPLSDLQSIQNLQEGMQLQAQTPYGVQTYRVAQIKESTVLMDGNHPLAGQTLNFSVKVNNVRDASEEELTAATQSSCCGGSNHDENGQCQSDGSGSCGCSH